MTPVTVGFATAARIPREQLEKTAKDRWDLSGVKPIEFAQKGWLTAADILEMRQGVTPGGCLELFLISESTAKQLELEDALVHKAIKTKQVERWKMSWTGQVLLYPYLVPGDKSTPAFTLDLNDIADKELRERVSRVGLKDSLDFDILLDSTEQDVGRRKGINQITAPQLLRHRVGLGLVKYPKVAGYLVQHYEMLEGRIFKKRNIRTFSRRWYEFLWPRDAKAMLSLTRIVSPTLMKEVRFSLDTKGYLSDHACLYLQPAKKTYFRYEDFRKQLAAAARSDVAIEDALKYCLAFLNSDYSQRRLVTGRRPTPKGFYTITEEFLKEIPIPPPKKTADKILNLVSQLLADKDDNETKRHEKALADVVNSLLKS